MIQLILTTKVNGTFYIHAYITCSFPLEIGKTLPKLSLSSLFSHDDLQTRAIAPLSKRMSALQLYTNDSVDNHSTNTSARSADVVDTLRLLYPLLTSLQYTIFTTTHWTISSFQHGVSHEQLSLIARCLTNIAPLLEGVYRDVARPCDVQWIAPSYDAPQCWIRAWSTSAYAAYYNSISSCEVRYMCAMFFISRITKSFISGTSIIQYYRECWIIEVPDYISSNYYYF